MYYVQVFLKDGFVSESLESLKFMLCFYQNFIFRTDLDELDSHQQSQTLNIEQLLFHNIVCN